MSLEAAAKEFRSIKERVVNLEKSLYGELSQQYFQTTLSSLNTSSTEDVSIAYNYALKDDKLISCV